MLFLNLLKFSDKMDLSDYRNKSGFDEGQADEVELLNFSDELDRLDIMMRYKN